MLDNTHALIVTVSGKLMILDLEREHFRQAIIGAVSVMPADEVVGAEIGLCVISSQLVLVFWHSNLTEVTVVDYTPKVRRMQAMCMGKLLDVQMLCAKPGLRVVLQSKFILSILDLTTFQYKAQVCVQCVCAPIVEPMAWQRDQRIWSICKDRLTQEESLCYVATKCGDQSTVVPVHILEDMIDFCVMMNREIIVVGETKLWWCSCESDTTPIAIDVCGLLNAKSDSQFTGISAGVLCFGEAYVNRVCHGVYIILLK